MLDDVRIASEARLREVRLSLESLEREESSRPGRVSTGFKASKGLFFVHLYGAFEFTVTQTVQRALREINNAGVTLKQLKPVVFSVALDAECRAVGDAGAKTRWQKRMDLFARTASADPVVIDDTVFPADGANLKYRQLESVWKVFDVPTPILPKMSIRGRLHEVTENRNAIAHGRDTPVAVGGRYSMRDLRVHFREIDLLSAHLLLAFEGYLSARSYIA